MKWLSSIASKVNAFFSRIADASREATQRAINAMQRDSRVGELEKRFTPNRLLGGFRLQRTGKHRWSKLTRHQVALRRPAGSKLAKKAAEHKL